MILLASRVRYFVVIKCLCISNALHDNARLLTKALSIAMLVAGFGCAETPTSSSRPVWSLMPNVPPRLTAGTPPNYSGVWLGQIRGAGCVAIAPCRVDSSPHSFQMEFVQNGIDLTGVVRSSTGQAPFAGYVSPTSGIVLTASGTYILEPTNNGFMGFYYFDEFSGGKLIRSTRAEITSLTRRVD